MALKRRLGDALRRNLDVQTTVLLQELRSSEQRLRAELDAVRAELAEAAARDRALRPTFVGNGLVLTAHPTGLLMLLDGACRTVTPRVLAGSYEPEVQRVLGRLVRPGDTVLEVGANQGFHTLTLAIAAGETGRVVAFEPNPRTGDVLRANLTMNGLRARVDVHAAAVSDHTGTVRFHALRDEPAGSYIRPEGGSWADSLPGDELEVPCVDVGQVVVGLADEPSLVKIDAEGHDVEILDRLLDVLPDAARTRFVVEWIPGVIGAERGRALLARLAGRGLVPFRMSGVPAPIQVDVTYLDAIAWEDVLFARPDDAGVGVTGRA